MPIAIGRELEADPSTLVVGPRETRLRLGVRLFGEATTLDIVYTLPPNRPVVFERATCTDPVARVEFEPSAPGQKFSIKRLPLPANRDVVVIVTFRLVGPVGGLVGFEVNADVRAADGSRFETSCEIHF